jgi:hypothetical protein
MCQLEAECETESDLHEARYCVWGYRVSGIGIGGKTKRRYDDESEKHGGDTLRMEVYDRIYKTHIEAILSHVLLRGAVGPVEIS